MLSAILGRMRSRSAFGLGLLAAACLLVRASTGCSTSNNAAGNSDAGGNGIDAASGAGDSGFVPALCNGGCLCFSPEACPPGCYVSQTAQPDGSASEPFCSNGIADCAPDPGSGWSFGAASSCPGLNPPGSRIALPDYPITYLDAGPDGAFCCDIEYEYAAVAAAEDAGVDAARDAASE